MLTDFELDDKGLLKELFKTHSPQVVMRLMIMAASEVADEFSDEAQELSSEEKKEDAKNLSQFVQALEDITSGRPFLV